MIKRTYIILLFLACLFLAGCIFKINKYEKATIVIKDKIILVDVADTPYKLGKGLSGRQSLAENQGMIFIFPKNSLYKFWMNEMKFPLDIIWIKDNKIVEMVKNMSIPVDDNISSYEPQNEANMVLEVGSGTIEKYNWQPGDEIQINFDR